MKHMSKQRHHASSDLFEPGAAALTSPGKQSLDLLVPWLEGLKHKGSEVVVVSYTEPGPTGPGLFLPKGPGPLM